MIFFKTFELKLTHFMKNLKSFNHSFTYIVLIFLEFFFIPESHGLPLDDIGDGKPATSAILTLVDGAAVGPDGSIYISHRSKNRVRKIDLKGIITTVAGNGKAGFSGDGVPATETSLNFPAGLTFDKEGNLYIADRNNHRIRKVDRNGIITTAAGNGVADMGGDNEPAINAQLNLPSDVAYDYQNNLYIADRSNNRIRKVDSEGIITTIAGLGLAGYGGDYGLAIDAYLKYPFGVAVDKKGNIFIADRGNNRIRKINPEGIITTIAGDGYHAFGGSYGPAAHASLAFPTGVEVDDRGNIYIADRNNNRIRKIDPLGIILPFAGTGKTDYNGDNEVASETNLHLPLALALDGKGNMIIVDRSHFRVRKIDIKKHTVETIAGTGKSLFKGDEGTALGATLKSPSGIVINSRGEIIFVDQSHNRIRRINSKGVISTIAGNGFLGNEGDGGPALKASLYRPTGLAIDQNDNMYVVSRFPPSWNIRKIDSDGNIHTFAGNGLLDDLGDGGRATQASFKALKDVAVDSEENIYIAGLGRVRKVNKQGLISSVSKDDWNNLDVETHPNGIAIGTNGSIYVSDSGSNKIRKILSDGSIQTIAGTGKMVDNGDGKPAINAGIRAPGGLTFSPQGELYIAEETTHRIRKIGKDGNIYPVAGTGIPGFNGDGGPAKLAMIKNPYRMVFDSIGNLYFTDRDNNRIRKVDLQGTISTIAGNSNFGWMQDGLEVRITVHNFP